MPAAIARPCRGPAVRLRLSMLLVLALASAASQAGPALEMLERMSAAMRELSYEGTFVHVHDNQLEAMRIIHQGGERGQRARLLALTGEAREVIRSDEGVTCILPDSKAVMIDRSLPRNPFAELPRDLTALQEVYRFKQAGSDRIAGRASRKVLIEPGDAYRYGYRFWLDAEHQLPLKTEILTNEGRPVEQMMFTDIEIVPRIPPADLQASLSGEGYSRFEARSDASEANRPAGADTDWRFAWVPAGFELRDHSWHGMPMASDKVEHWIFSDGLASVSVYIESLAAPGDADVLRGLSRMGAVNAMGRTLNGYHVTVVGEVPAVTVEKLAANLHRKTASND